MATWQQGNGDGDDQFIDCKGATAIAMALGQGQQEQWQWGKGMGQRHSHCDQSIVWV
jgi:hypothetical protein